MHKQQRPDHLFVPKPESLPKHANGDRLSWWVGKSRSELQRAILEHVFSDTARTKKSWAYEG